MAQVQGIELSRRFYAEVVSPWLAREFPGLSHAAALIGYGSELLGFDDAMSQDHNWGPRLQLYVDGADCEALARALGIRTVVEKQRELYLWGHTRVHLDEVAGLGPFLELETVITDQTQEEAERECREVQATLGIGEDDLIAGSYDDMKRALGQWR